MNTVRLKMFIIGLCALLCSTTLFGQGIVFFEGSYEELLKKAAEEKKPVLIDFKATWCGPCKYMEEKVFTQTLAGDYYNAHFICYQVDVDQNKELAQKFKVKAMPTLVFLAPTGQELNRVLGGLSGDRLVRAGQVALGERLSFEAMFDKYKQEPNDLKLQQELLLEAPDFVKTQAPEKRTKWFERFVEMYESYVSTKTLKNMINPDDFHVLTLFHQYPEKVDSVLLFVLNHHEAYRDTLEKPNDVTSFLFQMHCLLLQNLAKAGDLEYLQQLERVKGDLADVFGRLKHPTLDTYTVLKGKNDALYCLYAKKDQQGYVELKNQYFEQLGNGITASDYNEAISELYTATKGNLNKESYKVCVTWLDKMIVMQSEPKEQMRCLVLMGNFLKELDDIQKAKSCYNQAYVLAMQLDMPNVQQQIKAMIDGLY